MEIKRRPVPGSLDNESLSEPCNNPFELLQTLQDEWRSKEHEVPWSADKMSELDVGDIDWHKYDPPSVLRKAPNVTSLILLDIIAESIENVKARIAEEDSAKRADEERRKAVEEEGKQKGKSSEPYLPIIIPPEPSIEPDTNPLESSSNRENPFVSFDTLSITANGKAKVSTAKDGGRRRFAIRRLFHKVPESGESSASGRAREALRQKLEARLSRVDIGSADSKTQEAVLALRKSGFIKDSEPPKPDPEVECVSCLDDIPVKESVKVACHSYCKDCFTRLVAASVQNEQQWPPKCCLNQIPFHLVLKHIPDDLKTTFQERASEWELPVSERVYCNQPECGVWIRPKNIKLNKRQGRCERGHLTCTICRGPSHGNGDCPQDFDMNLTNILAEEEGWKRCSNCHALVEHREACQHMTCRCGHEFCYVCGSRWKTCRCTMVQLYALKDAADNRREQRQFREQAEAEELRAILAQIEEFEREEARRAELERQEQARLEEERWQRQIKERIRQESSRRKEVEAKFAELRIRLDEIRELHQVMLETYQEEAATDLLHEADTIKQNLARRHDAERHDLNVRHSAAIASTEDYFQCEYSIRAAKERKLEDKYLSQLQQFYADKPRCEELVERAMYPLRKRMDRGHIAWQAWKDVQMALFKAKVDDERTMREELMYSQRERMKDLCDEKELELTRAMVAEKKWFQEVVLERERLLGGYEVQEMEGDADSLFAREDEE